MTQKGLAPILIVLILAALVGGYLIYQNQPKPTPSPQPFDNAQGKPTQPSPTSDPTANWKTYTNKIAGYSIKYPSEIQIMTKAAGLGSIEASDDSMEVNINTLKISVFDYPPPEYEYSDWIKTNLTINGMQAIKYEKDDNDIEKVFYLFNNQKTAYYIQFYFQDPNQQNREIYDQILSTFKFIK